MKRVLSILLVLLAGTLALADENGWKKGILGDDDRETIYYPENDYRSEDMSIGQLQMSDIDGKNFGTCSGTLIGANLVLTAAHCFYLKKGEDGSSIVRTGKTTFSLQKSKEHTPYDPVTASMVFLPDQFFKNMADDEEQVSRHQIGHDYAIVVLNDAIGDEVGWHGVRYDTDENSSDVTILSYPGDFKGALAYEECYLEAAYGHPSIYGVYCDVIKGSSGGGLLADDGTVIAIVSGAGNYLNYAMRFTRETFEVLKSWYVGDPIYSATHAFELDQYNRYKVIFKNKCHERISVGFKVKKEHGWVTDGLYILQQGESFTLSNVIDKEIYFYAKTRSGGEWRGDYDIYLDDYDRYYPFIKQNMNLQGNGTFTQRFTCN